MHHGMRQYCNCHIWDKEGANHPRSGGPKWASLLGLLAKVSQLVHSFPEFGYFMIFVEGSPEYWTGEEQQSPPKSF